MKIDLHIHSSVSDGRLSPTEVVEFAHKNNLDVIALSDHDDISGISEATEASMKYGIKLIPATELTCSSKNDIEKLPQNLAVHILGYNIDYQNENLIKRLAAHRIAREDKCKSVVKKISEFGYLPEYDSMKFRTKKRMRIADVTEHLKLNFQENENRSACIRYLEGALFYELRNSDFSICEAINLIHEFNGKAVWAHPYISYTDYTTEYLDNDSLNILLDYLCELGIDGIEADYMAFNSAQKEYLSKLADERNLIATIGSDFHGGEKRNIMISEECRNIEELREKIIYASN